MSAIAPFYLPLAIQQDDLSFTASRAPMLKNLPLVQQIDDEVVILQLPVGNQAQGVYAFNRNRWWYSMSIQDMDEMIVNGSQLNFYISPKQNDVAPVGSTVFKNGQQQIGLNIVADGSVYIVAIPPAGGTGGAVTSVNGQTGIVTVNATNLPGLATVGKTGSYNDLTDLPAPYSLPTATATTMGGVIIPSASNLVVDGSGNIDVKPSLITTINGKIGSVVSGGSGTSAIESSAAGVVTLRSIAAGAGISVVAAGGTITITNTAANAIATTTTLGSVIVGSGLSVDGAGVLSANAQPLAPATASDLGGVKVGAGLAVAGDGTLSASPTAATASVLGSVKVGSGLAIDGAGVLSFSGGSATAGTYTQVTINNQGLVTSGTNPTTLAGYGITDALPLAGGSLTGNITMTSGAFVTGLPAPVGNTDAANKAYVDSTVAAVANGVKWKAQASVATTAQQALTGLPTIDTYTVLAGDRVLVKNQTLPAENGVYVAAAGAWTRSTDTDTGAEILNMAILVLNGSANKLTQWVNTNTTTPNLGTDPITYGQLQGAATVYTASNGITLTGVNFTLANSGVTAGTYTKVTVNAQGQVTAGANLALSDITAALGYTPYNGTTNPNGYITGAQPVALTGDVTGNGVTGTPFATVLAASGVTAGTYTKVTVDAKGRVTVGAQISNAEISAAIGYTPVNKAGDTMTGALNGAPAANVSSAASAAVGSAASNFINILGTTTINGFDAAPNGSVRTVRFAGVLTLTYNASNFVLPTAANIVTAAGDTAQFTSNGTGWICNYYQRFTGLPVAGAAVSPFTTTQEFDGSTTQVAAKFKNIVEIDKIIGVAPAALQDFSISEGSVQYFTVAATINFNINFRHDAALSLNTALAIGESVTVAAIMTQGASAFVLSGIRIDGAAVTPKWQGGTAPGSGNANSLDVYSFTIIKTAVSTFTVLASQTQFK